MDREVIHRLAISRDFLADNCAGGVSLGEVAEVATMSPFHFHRLFSQRYGMTPQEFKTQLRLDRAKELLLANTLSISEIAFELGYESPATFSTLFRKRFGLNPTEFRFRACRAYALGRIWGHRFIPHCFTSQRYSLPTK
ncbi:MAG: helix-turn-helix transcriptional regulator [Armatimonadetes bacterium]|nr:helix-turn-helix transcriptional regulator [Armatimonadota bacterium]